MITIEQQQKIFLDLGRALPRAITTYAIGGTAMMFLGLKSETLDVDLVFNNKKDREVFKETALSLGYREFEAKIVYGLRPKRPIMVSLDDVRLDLFLHDVINTKFSDSMARRALDTHTFDKNLIVKIANMHDIIIMKSVTSRAKDLEDITNIINKKSINWEIILDEAKEQVALGNEHAILGLGEKLEKLNNLKAIKVPKDVLDGLWKLLKKQTRDKGKKRYSRV